MAPTLEWWEMGLRLLAAAALGGLIGFEREQLRSIDGVTAVDWTR